MGSHFDQRYCQTLFSKIRNHDVWPKILKPNEGEAAIVHVGTYLHDFCEDGYSFHHTKIVTGFVMANKITLLKWPDNSPNLNPIENFLTIIKD